MKIVNSKVTLVLFFLFLITFANQASAYRVVKYRDHWGIFGGYSMVESRSIYENAELVEVHIDCRGDGQMGCSALKANNDIDLMFSTGNIHCGLIDALFTKADDMLSAGTTCGSFSQIHAVQQMDGTVKNFQFTVNWNASENSECMMQMEITEIVN